MKGLINEKQLSAKECTKPLGRPNEENKNKNTFLTVSVYNNRLGSCVRNFPAAREIH